MNATVTIGPFLLAWARGSVAEHFHAHDLAADGFLEAVRDAPTPMDATWAMTRAFAAADAHRHQCATRPTGIRQWKPNTR